jgi:hypothetical protein
MMGTEIKEHAQGTLLRLWSYLRRGRNWLGPCDLSSSRWIGVEPDGTILLGKAIDDFIQQNDLVGLGHCDR